MDDNVTPALVIEFGDETGTFKAHPDANQFLLSRHLDNMFSPGAPGLKAITTLILDQVLDEDRPRLEAFLEKHGRADNFLQPLYDALEACWSGDTSIPLSQPSDSSKATEGTDEPEEPSTVDLSSEVTLEPVAVS